MKQLQHNKRPKGHITKAEAKILFTIFYYVILGGFTLTDFSYAITTYDDTLEAFQTYFTCQIVGIQPDRDCGDSPDIQSQVSNTLALMVVILQGLFPLANLIFIMNCSCDKRCCKGVRSLLTSKSHVSKQSAS